MTPRKVDLELARLKSLGKVSKKDEETLNNDKHINQQQQQQDNELLLHTLQDQLQARLQEIEQQRKHQQQLEQQLAEYKTQLVRQEQLAHDTIADYLGKVESSQLQIRQLIDVLGKQDQLIHLLTEQQSKTKDWDTLYLDKQQLEIAIGSLKANIESNQAQMQMMMMVSTEIQNDFERQKLTMEKRMMAMTEELATKDALLLQYQEQSMVRKNYRLSPPTPSPTASTRPSTFSDKSYPPPLYLSSAPSSPPPTTPLPPIPHFSPSSPTVSLSSMSSSSSSHHQQGRSFHQQQLQSTTMTPIDPLISPIIRPTSVDGIDQHGKPFWKNMKKKWRVS
ncbi:uncharacterized protein BX664DRAFT_326561 [Halteromyces radiatus]|uniref:uncharacterized protein n=1 Tax=Halteromyces radiatus TaxID=101107 RepID=UPI00221EAB7F|nr:uncharacterized protein BX664DRAFT_326561 [Halteromyces radiatus]KAI8097499.1 hypothetical protein BX664DRAFT_326561 [Halteromyces radiatus]